MSAYASTGLPTMSDFDASLVKGKTCFVYVVCKVNENEEMCAPVKVGMAYDIDKRISQLKTSCPFKIALFSGYITPRRDIAAFLERRFHRCEREHRLHGEWFDMGPCAAATKMMVNMIVLFRKQYKLDPDFTEKMLRKSVDDERLVDLFKYQCGAYWNDLLSLGEQVSH